MTLRHERGRSSARQRCAMNAASRSATRGLGSACARAGALGLAVLVLTLPPPTGARAARLGGPYFVDDAEIGPVGSCEFQQLASSAHNGDHIYGFSPACVVQFGAPVEIGTNHVNLRSDGVVDPVVSLTAKTVPIPLPGGGRAGFGLALSGEFIWDTNTNSFAGMFLNMPLTYDFNDRLRLNVNVGTLYIADPSVLLATGGLGVSWNFADEWTVISEVFALVGPGQTNPRYQTGLRYSPIKAVDCDFIYGRNLTGEGANWFTVALTVRVGADN
jgi:hypothetical protein